MAVLGASYPQPRRGRPVARLPAWRQATPHTVRCRGGIHRMPEYSIGRLNKCFCLTWWRDGKRHRYSLGTNDPREAERLAPALYAELTRPKGTTVEDLWRAYVRDKAGRAVTVTMGYTWKALRDRFGPMEAHAVTVADCRAHRDARVSDAIRDGTIHTELGHLRMVLVWAEKRGLIAHAPHIERPPKPRPRERHLTREQVRTLFDERTPPPRPPLRYPGLHNCCPK